jgi:hypothetical protein
MNARCRPSLGRTMAGMGAGGRRTALGVAYGALAAMVSACSHGSIAPAAPPARAATPIVEAGPVKPALLTPVDVDARLRAVWASSGVTPTPPADDATWLRRAWVDVLGTIPPAEAVRRFLSDPTPIADKRARVVEDLLRSPLWADHWTGYWDDVWMARGARNPDVDRGAFRAWLHAAFARNLAWDQLATELLTASGQSSQGGPKVASEINDGHDPLPDGINGAVNFTLSYQDAPQDLAGTAARTLLGVQIQCAQCHDHKTEKWTQSDFQSFAAAFARTRPVVLDPGPPMGAVRRVELRELDRAAPRFAKMADLDPIIKAAPVALDGTQLGGGPSVRAALAKWLTDPHNPWFSRALVNRMWGHFLGRGFVDPVDDLRPSNPASSPELFDLIAADFVASGYDLKHLVSVIVGSDAYARSAVRVDDATLKVDPEDKLWERFRVQPLDPDELLSALVSATQLDGIVRATGRLDLAQVRYRVRQRYRFLFDVDEETDDGDYDGTIAQALALLNGSVVATGSGALPGGVLSELFADPGDDRSKVETLYLRTLARTPTRAESDRWARFIVDAETAPAPPNGPPAKRAPRGPRSAKGRQPDPLAGLEGRAGAERANARVRAFEDVLWTLLNSSEFVLNH